MWLNNRNEWRPLSNLSFHRGYDNSAIRRNIDFSEFRCIKFFSWTKRGVWSLSIDILVLNFILKMSYFVSYLKFFSRSQRCRSYVILWNNMQYKEILLYRIQRHSENQNDLCSKAISYRNRSIKFMQTILRELLQ